MALPTDREKTKLIPKWKKRHHSYDESVDESQKLIEAEPTEIEEERPAEENEPLESVEENTAETPVFEE